MWRLVKSPRLQGLQGRLQTRIGAATSVDCDRATEAIKIDDNIRDNAASVADLTPGAPANAAPSSLLQERLRLLGLDADFVAMAQIETFRKLQQTCSACPSWRRCAYDLGSGDVASGMECYCLNATKLDELLIEKFRG